PRAKYTVCESLLQKPSLTCPSANDVTATGRPCPSAPATYRFATPARSQLNTTRFPSGDHTGFDGCLMSISCSIVSRPFPCPCATDAHARPKPAPTEFATHLPNLCICRLLVLFSP